MTIQQQLESLATPERALNAARFFKTGPGQYGEGDVFLGVTVPDCRKVAKIYKDLPLDEILVLLKSKYHEHRLTALILLVNQYKKANEKHKKAIYDLYMANTAYINNWDLVDTSAGSIVGHQLGKNYKSTLTKLAKSQNIWERRIAMISCFYYIVNGDPEPGFYIIDLLKYDDHDLIQKAVGWMLRETGKRCGKDLLEAWLLKNGEYKTLPRTTLRYAIEHFTANERQKFLAGKA